MKPNISTPNTLLEHPSTSPTPLLNSLNQMSSPSVYI